MTAYFLPGSHKGLSACAKKEHYLMINSSFATNWTWAWPKPQQQGTINSRYAPTLIQTCFFSLPLIAALEDTPSRYSKVRVTAEGESRPFLRVVIYWNKRPASVVTAPSVNAIKKRLENVWTEVHLIRVLYQFIFYRVTEIIFGRTSPTYFLPVTLLKSSHRHFENAKPEL